MAFGITEEQQLMINIAREFAANEVRPRAKQVDITDERPLDLFARAAELGLRGILIPEEWGGLGAGLLTQAMISETLAQEGYIGASLVNNLMATPILKVGTQKQKEKYLQRLASGEISMGFGFTEASAGSDAANIETTAVKDGDTWVLNGTKIFISMINADAFLVSAKTNETAPGGISSFIVEKDFPGFSIGGHYKKIGMHGSDTADLYLKNCRVPAENMMGVENKGLHVVLSALDIGRMNIASAALGLAEGAYERAVAYARQRVQFGKPIAHFQVIQHYAADMLKDIELVKAMIYRTASRYDAGESISRESAICKLAATEMACRVTDRAVQICGGYGLTEDGGIERYFRDARVLPIVEGTNEIQKMIIARTIFPKK
ncbi:acyl-CoA dehydrogenase family protein [Sporomusa sp.]|uniref:acyl-CoA dehydrogenase family protein n=1 Tax=Sporomusa sp. TaxID=2078658 RepID=UPI002BB01EED|nr:acyl-CoA dehydrogenase family protein [Sporomusa sp.]HWR05744.1 acyl-CoA dehydrogenase family protein [Sporomusa sp.]